MSVETKVWISKVQEEQNGDLVILFEEGFIQAMGWKAGDTLIWSQPDEKGNIVLRKLEK